MQASDIAALPVRLGAAIRGRRLFHPIGVLAEGILERVAPPDEGLPMQSCDVIGTGLQGIGLTRRRTRHRGPGMANPASAGSAIVHALGRTVGVDSRR